MAKKSFEIKTLELSLVPTDTGRLWDKPWNIIRNKDSVYVGTFTFKGRANNGVIVVEISIKEQYRRKGYGTQTLRGIRNWVIGRDGVNKINGVINNDDEVAMGFLVKNNYELTKVDGRKATYELKSVDMPWIPICVSLFSSAGLAIGFTVHQVLTGVVVGLVMGVIMGIIFKNVTKKRREEATKAALEAANNNNKNKKKKR